MHRLDQSIGLVQPINGLEVQIQIRRASRTNADGVHPGVTQTEEIVEDNGMQWVTQLQQTLRGGVEMAALVGGTDDEHPHVLLLSSIQRRRVVLADVIPMDIHVVERSAVAAGDNHIRRPVGGEPHMTDASIGLPSTDHVHAAPGTQGLLQMLGQVDAVNGQQIQTLAAEPLKTEGQLILEGIRVLPRWHLALQDPRRVRRCCDGPPQLPLGAAVVTGCLDVMKTKVRGALQRGLQVGLGIRRDLICRQVSPALLKTHPTQ